MIADSSVLIPLARAGKLGLLRVRYRKVRVTPSIEKETVYENKVGSSEIKKAIGQWIIVQKTGKGLERDADELAVAENISRADAEIILLAQKNREDILTNDYRLAIVAKANGIKAVWPTAFLLECMKRKIITRPKAKETLLELVKNGLRLSPEVFAEALRLMDVV
ncbi:MAG: hypothetical protein HY544_04290 [Candidatus Diapherotrites archaeon]|uniref:PIN domain-containing protein n=1 Tax=Candidatus Iainarchaeum sp. TaxID=3101447 RepID=A0A8T3YN49_9ARCH|nr:hypothetical protein [Candidatus Diapherotrites archaeon]